MTSISGETRSLKPADRAELEKLSEKRTAPTSFIDIDLSRRVARAATRMGKQIGLLIGRDGRIVQTVIGAKERLYLPDLGRFRLDSSRLRRLRLVVFVPEAEHRMFEHRTDDNATFVGLQTKRQMRQQHRGVFSLSIPDDFLTDLEKLRLDALLLVAIDSVGEPGPVSLAFLDPSEDQGGSGLAKRQKRNIAAFYGESLGDIAVDFQTFISDLEAQIGRTTERGFATGGDKAILIGAYTVGPLEAEASMNELRELARTADLDVCDVISQRRRSLDPRTVIGAGKVETVTLRALDLGADLLVFDRELTPSQLRSITNMTELRVIDRSMLILDIFAQRAKSSEGRLQVELAQLKYSLPRLTEKDSGLSRLTGGIGGRGPGETKLEISRRRVRDRLSDLERRIDKVSDQRGVQRKRRQERGVPVVAIVGYTNSGKSTLLNSLTKGGVLVENKLFATLDPSSRRMRFPNEREVVFVDTVGFIRELPKELVNAFRATLEEVGEADLLVQLVDASNPDMRKQIDVVIATLESLGFGEKPRILVLNKIDLLSEFQQKALQSSYDALAVSALQRIGFEQLVNQIQDELRHCFQGGDPGSFIASPVPNLE